MIEAGASDLGSIAALVAISFFAFIAGASFRKWPEKIGEYAEGIDGSISLLTPEAHRAVIGVCGHALTLISIATLVAAGLVI